MQAHKLVKDCREWFCSKGFNFFFLAFRRWLIKDEIYILLSLLVVNIIINSTFLHHSALHGK